MPALFTEEVTLTDEDFRDISQLVYDHCGINLHEGKKELIRARLAKKLRAGGFRSFPQYMEHVQKDESGREFSDFIDLLSTNLTSFFRERQHFDFLETRFLPQLIEHKKSENCPRVRVWSAGCSSGEEPYSLAITLLESLPAGWDTKILATDISTRILKKARAGIYPSERLQPIPVQLRTKYFAKKSDAGQQVFEANQSLRQLILFKYLNLTQNWPIRGPLDFIFCRNVMIYFDKPTQAGLVRKFFDLLSPGGLLFTGHSESLTGIEHAFKYIQPTIYKKP